MERDRASAAPAKSTSDASTILKMTNFTHPAVAGDEALLTMRIDSSTMRRRPCTPVFARLQPQIKRYSSPLPAHQIVTFRYRVEKNGPAPGLPPGHNADSKSAIAGHTMCARRMAAARIFTPH
jgi:hypothetical protein